MKISKKLFEKLSKITIAEIDPNGNELLNPVPLTVDVEPVGMTIEERIQRAFRIQELSREAARQGEETFEDFMDFDVPEPEDVEYFQSRYELDEAQEMAEDEYMEGKKQAVVEQMVKKKKDESEEKKASDGGRSDSDDQNESE